MARMPTYEPRFIELLQAHPDGLTRKEIAEELGCSRQQVHKIVAKGKLPETDRAHLPIEIERGPQGADIVRWVGERIAEGSIVVPVGERRVHMIDGELPALGAKLTVVGMSMEGGRVEVVVEDETGHRTTFAKG